MRKLDGVPDIPLEPPEEEGYTLCNVCYGEIYSGDEGYYWDGGDEPIFCHKNCLKISVINYIEFASAHEIANLRVDAITMTSKKYTEDCYGYGIEHTKKRA